MTDFALYQPIILSFCLFVIIAILIAPMTQRIRLPFAAVLVIVGFVGSALLTAFGFTEHFQNLNLNALIYYGIIPIIILELAYRSDLKYFKVNATPILLLSLPILFLSTGLIALLMYWGLGQSIHFPITTALVAAALLAITDPLNLIAHLKNNHISKSTMIMIEGESLFSAVLAVSLLATFSALALSIPNADTSRFSQAGWHLLSFLWLLIGGIFWGMICGFIGGLLSSVIKQKLFQNILLLIVAYSAFLLAESYLRVSGLMSIAIVGLIMGKAHNSFISKNDKEFIREGWAFASFCSQGIIYLLLGTALSFSMFIEYGMAMLLAIAAVIISRTVSIYGILPSKLPTNKSIIDTRSKNSLFLAGTRGAITAALALTLSIDLVAWQTVQAMAFAVVLYSLFIHAPLAPILLEKYLTKQTPSQINLFKNHRRRN